MEKFNKGQFEAQFVKALQAIAGAERVTKEELKTLSRNILIAWHETGNCEYANKLLAVLTPVNKKVFVAFGKHFAGFSHDDVLGVFTKKSKKRYEKAHADYVEFMADPHNNIWTWAERHIEVTHKPFDVDGVAKYITKALKQAQGVGLSQVDVLKAVFKGGIEPAAVLTVFEEMGLEFSEVEAEDNAPLPDAPM
jgi:hypothetical protein